MTPDPAMSPPPVPDGYAGNAFAPTLPEGRAAGVLSPGDDGVAFVAGERRLVLPWEGLRLRLGGASDRLVFFEPAGDGETSFYTADHGVLAHPALLARPELRAAIAAIRGRKRRRLATTAGVLAALVAIVAVVVSLKDPLVGLVVARIPPALEVRLGEAAFSQIRLSTPLVDDPALDAELAALAAPLLAAIPDPGYAFRLHLADTPDVNAFALPGGHVVVNAGLVLEAGSPEEVLGVLAHEVAHVTRRHSLRQLVSSAGVFLLVQTFFGDLSGLMAVAVDGGSRLLTLSFSRDLEREADDSGWTYLVDAGIDPRGLSRFFERLQAKQSDAGAALDGGLAFLSTHPASAERISSLEARAAALARTFEPVIPPERLEALQDRIRDKTRAASETPSE